MAQAAGSADRPDVIFGLHAVKEALRAGRPLIRLQVISLHGQFQELVHIARIRHIPVHVEPKAALDRLAVGGRHQGVVASVAARAYAEPGDLLAVAEVRREPAFIVVLDGIQDPQNFGAILRSAEAAGVHGVVIPDRRAVGVTGAVEKASAGAVEHLKVAHATNISRLLTGFKEVGLWVYGLDRSGDRNYTEPDYRGPVALVIGGEGIGIRKHVLEHCDERVRIPMLGRVNSLNASAAAALACFEVVRQRMAGHLSDGA
ncbi:MAG: 23S rRNA (guanosine(2251)-2'-O)-methyltransferase RlmB [Nitrospiraceae bacterium]